MRDHQTEKEYGPVDRARELSGIYKLGFDPESAKGFMLPFIIVGLIGGLGGLIIWQWL